MYRPLLMNMHKYGAIRLSMSRHCSSVLGSLASTRPTTTAAIHSRGYASSSGTVAYTKDKYPHIKQRSNLKRVSTLKITNQLLYLYLCVYLLVLSIF
jgi:hypothetical protein